MVMQIKLIVVVVECSGSSSFRFSCSQEVFLECCFSEDFHAIFCIPGLKISEKCDAFEGSQAACYFHTMGQRRSIEVYKDKHIL